MTPSETISLARHDALTDFWSFCSMLEYEKLSRHEHYRLCRFVQDFYESDCRVALVCAPRGTLKTTICSIAFPLWLLCLDPDNRILLDGRTRAQAMERLSSISDLVTSKELINICFPGLKGDKTWNREEILVGTRRDASAKESSVSTSGIDVEKTGSHYNLIVSDDLCSEKNTETEEQKKAVILHIQANMPLLDAWKDGRPGKMLYPYTPWTQDDPSSWLSELPIQKRKFHTFAYSPRNLDIQSMTEDDFKAAGGVLNYPVSAPFATLKTNREVMGLSLFQSQFQTTAVMGKNAKFNVALIRSLRHGEAKKDGVRRFITVDPAGDPTHARSKTGDNTGIAVTAFDADGGMHIEEILSGRFTEKETVDKTLLLAKAWKPFSIGVERTGLGNVIAPMREEASRLGLYLTFEDITPKGRSKYSRISQLSPLVEGGRLSCRSGSPGVDAFLLQMAKVRNDGAMPGGKDEMDAVAMALDLVAKYGTPAKGFEAPKPNATRAALDSTSRAFWEEIAKQEERAKRRKGFPFILHSH